MSAQKSKQQAKARGLRSLLSTMPARPAASAESEAWRTYQHVQSFQAPPLDLSPRAVKNRTINRIAAQFSWGPDAIALFLTTRGAAYLADLTEPQLDDLHERMLAYEDATMNGYGPPDSPVA